MPPEALHRATTTPMIRAVSEPRAETGWRPTWTAWLKTVEAPGGSALSRPSTSRWTVPVPTCTRFARPSSAMSAGNSARNQ